MSTNGAIVASCGVISLLEDGDNVRLLPLLRDCGLLKRCSVDGSQDWCQLHGRLPPSKALPGSHLGRSQFGYLVLPTPVICAQNVPNPLLHCNKHGMNGTWRLRQLNSILIQTMAPLKTSTAAVSIDRRLLNAEDTSGLFSDSCVQAQPRYAVMSRCLAVCRVLAS